MPNTTTIAATFPWRPGNPDRDAAARWVIGQWRQHHPDIPTTHSRHLPTNGPWRKATHIWHLTNTIPADILIVSDVDVWVDPAAIRAAVDTVDTGQAGWAAPHGDVYRLSPRATRALLALPSADRMPPLRDGDLAEPPYPGHLGGGIIIIRREVALEVPLDPRFEGWGQEDDSWGLALRALAGPPWRGKAPLLHLWHPPAARKSRRHGTRAGLTLYRRYEAACAGTTGPMRALTNEARDLLTVEHTPPTQVPSPAGG